MDTASRGAIDDVALDDDALDARLARARRSTASTLDALEMLRLLAPADALALGAALSDGRARPEAGDARPSFSTRE